MINFESYHDHLLAVKISGRAKAAPGRNRSRTRRPPARDPRPGVRRRPLVLSLARLK
jgi:hypothetical protein